MKQYFLFQIKEFVTKYKMTRHFFLYGSNYDAERGQVPREGESSQVVVYVDFRKEKHRAVGSLEGVFVSEKINPFPNVSGSCFVRREKMDAFEEEYGGRFFPFWELSDIAQIVPEIMKETDIESLSLID